jgi:large subunit ribosomal protein L35
MKAKTHSGSQKRVKVTATGKFRTAKIGKRHLLQNKSSQSKGRGKYGAATHVANERKMKWGHQVAGLRTPTAKKNIVQKTADGKIIKAPRRAPVIKAAGKQIAAPKATKTAAPKKAPAKATAKKSAPKKK